MTAPYPVPAARHRTELVERRSRFIATCLFADSVAAARAAIEEVRAEMSDATHHVYAFAVGFGPSVTHGMSDDGEPSGTAGRPVLTVLQTSGLGDACVVVTRYFGGTKLGTGGLVRAYTRAAQDVLASVPRAVREERVVVELEVPYALYETVARLVAAHRGRMARETFGADVSLAVDLPAEAAAAFAGDVAEASAGRVAVRGAE